MKRIKFYKVKQIAVFTLFNCCILNYAFCQVSAIGMQYVKAYNSNCYILTRPGQVFTWEGNCYNNYCEGFGTAIYYDNAGNFYSKYTGNLKNGKKDGYGTYYDQTGNINYQGEFKDGYSHGYGKILNYDGTVYYQGYFSYGKFEDEPALLSIAGSIGKLLVDKVFDGGTNCSYTLTKMKYSKNLDDIEMRIKMTFNGDIITENYYNCTAVITSSPPYLDFVNYNKTAEQYLAYKFVELGAKLIDEISEELNKK